MERQSRYSGSGRTFSYAPAINEARINNQMGWELALDYTLPAVPVEVIENGSMPQTNGCFVKTTFQRIKRSFNKINLP